MGIQEYARKVTRLDKKGRKVGGVSLQYPWCSPGGGLALVELTGHVFNLDVRSVEFGLEGSGDGFGCYARGVCFSVCLGVCWCSHGKARVGGGEGA